MRNKVTVFAGLIKAFPHRRVRALVAHHDADNPAQRLPSWSQTIAMVHPPDVGREVTAFERFSASHTRLGLKPVRHSTFIFRGLADECGLVCPLLGQRSQDRAFCHVAEIDAGRVPRLPLFPRAPTSNVSLLMHLGAYDGPIIPQVLP